MVRFTRIAPLSVFSALLLVLALATVASAATYDVDTTIPDYRTACTADAQDCSLYGALDNATGSEEDDTIVLPAGIYRVGPESNGFYVGPWDVSDAGKLTIQGAGAGETILDADGNSRVMTIEDSVVEISGVTLRDGYSRDDLDNFLLAVELDGDTPVLNAAGGGRERLPAAAGLSGLGPIDGEGLFLESGGGLRVLGSDVTLTDSVVAHNNAGQSGAAGGILSVASRLRLVRSTVHRNNANVAGGGIVNIGILELEDSTVSDNIGAIAGGGILNLGRMTVDSSTISGNFSIGHGGGVLDIGIGLIELPAPGLAANAVEPDPEEIFGDSVIRNSTLSDNAVRFGQGGAVLRASLGPVALPLDEECLPQLPPTLADPCKPEPPKLVLLDDTFADNSLVNAANQFIPGGDDWAGRGASIYAAGLIQIGNSVIADGNDRGAGDNCGDDDDSDLIESLGNNIETAIGEDEEGNLFGDCFDVPRFALAEGDDLNDTVVEDVRLGSLRDNGGPTKTRALRAGSPAIDSYAGEACGDTDQRGGARPPESGSAGEACDAGAYEANSLADLSIDSHTDAPDPVTVGSPLTYSIVVRNSGPDAINGVTVTHALPAGVELVSAANGNVGTLAPGESRTLEAIVRPTAAGALASTATVSAAGMTDTDPANDSKSTSTQAAAAAQLPPQEQPQQGDNSVNLTLNAPATATVDQFMDGIVVEASCEDEPCLRRFREHAAINTGATRIAGFNLTVSRTFLPMSSTKTRVRLRPCLSGSKTGRRHKRCMRNLRKAVKKAGTFKVKVVVSATDQAGNTVHRKAFVKITPKRS